MFSRNKTKQKVLGSERTAEQKYVFIFMSGDNQDQVYFKFAGKIMDLIYDSILNEDLWMLRI